jgi:hypothetical protein
VNQLEYSEQLNDLKIRLQFGRFMKDEVHFNILIDAISETANEMLFWSDSELSEFGGT